MGLHGKGWSNNKYRPKGRKKELFTNQREGGVTFENINCMKGGGARAVLTKESERNIAAFSTLCGVRRLLSQGDRSRWYSIHQHLSATTTMPAAAAF
jgi:hypothetical protein